VLADQTPAMQLQERSAAPTWAPWSQRRSVQLAQALSFLAAAGVVLIYALRGGGSYDLVSFEEQGLVIWWILAAGIALGLLPRRRPSRTALLLLGALAAYAGWIALSLLWTQSAELTTEELARALDYLGLVALALCVLDRDTWRPAAAGLGFGALVVCVIALGSRLAPAAFGTDEVAAFLHSSRLSYPFGYWNAIAACGAMCTTLGLAWSAHDPSRARRAVALALVPVAATMTYVTYSRAGAYGTGIGVIAVIALSRNRITTALHAVIAAAGAGLAIVAVRGAPQIVNATGTRGAGAVAGALVFAAALCAATAISTRLAGVDRSRVPPGVRRPLAVASALAVLAAGGAVGPRIASRAWHSFKRVPAGSTSTDPATRLTSLSGARYQIWRSAIKAFDAHPVGGTGAGTFEYWWNQHGTEGEFIRDAHNLWVENMAELGLPGLLLIVAVAASAVGVAVAARLRARRSASAGAAAAFAAVMIVYLVHATVDWMWESTAVTVLAFGGVAVIGARLSGRRVRLRLIARAGLVVVAATAAAVQLPGLMSSLDIRRSQAAQRDGDTSAALALSRDAVSAEPWSASAHEQQALALEASDSLQQAKHQETLAISDESTNYAHWLIRARIKTELGELGAAARDYERAHSLRPRAFVFLLAPSFRMR